MRQNDIIRPLIAFLIACAVGLVITFFGLRWYYDDERLGKALTRSYAAEKMDILAGKAKLDNDALLVSDVQPEGFSFINVGLLRIDSRFYEEMSIIFDEKQPHQPLLLAVRHQDNEQPLERPLAYSNQLVQHFLLSDIAPNDEIITDVGLITDKVISPYRIQSIVFDPKPFDYKLFADLLMDCFAINTQWENWSINTHRSPYPVLIPPKILVLIYFTVVGLLFLAYLRLTRRPLINAWWATLVAAWFALDTHYLVEKTVITKNTYDTFAHLSDDEKDLVLSPEAARIAQTIKSVLPNDGKRKKIRIQFGWGNKSWLWEPNRRYLNGKLHYMLQPNIIYTLGVQVPDNIWEQGGFYYVDARQPKEHLAFNQQKEILNTETGKKIVAKRLFNNDDMVIYQVLGGTK